MSLLKEFIENNEDFVKRCLMVVFGMVMGTIFVMASTVIKNEHASIAILVFGCVTYGGFIFGALVDYIDW